jgi:hypothetical protein
MLERYTGLSRLLKEYRRDLKNNQQNYRELKDINDEYNIKNKEGKLMALSALSSNVKKGLRQGLYIWR